MGSSIEIYDELVDRSLRLPHRVLERRANRALRAIQKRKGILSVAFVTPDLMKKINFAYAGKNKVTDVLAFPMYEKNSSTYYDVWGEVVICPAVAKKQAGLFFNTYQEEVERLLVHGILHIGGYDHNTTRVEKRMLLKTKEILNKKM